MVGGRMGGDKLLDLGQRQLRASIPPKQVGLRGHSASSPQSLGRGGYRIRAGAGLEGAGGI